MNDSSGDALTRTLIIVNLGVGVCPPSEIISPSVRDLAHYRRALSCNIVVHRDVVPPYHRNAYSSDAPVC